MLLRRKKKITDRYATFSRRMWAATVDSTLVLIVVLPVFGMVFNIFYPWPAGAPTMVELQQRVNLETDIQQMLIVFWKEFYGTGLFFRWLADTLMQTVILGISVALCWWKWSSTPGKMLFRMKIVDADTEQPISNRQIRLRVAGYFLAGLPLMMGFFWINFNKRRQGWHDLLANTLVVIVPKKIKSDSEAAHPSDSPAP